MRQVVYVQIYLPENSFMKLLYGFCCLAFFFGCQQRPPESIVVVTPTSVSTKIDRNDSAYLKIRLGPGKYEVSLLGKTLATNNPELIDRFISDHKAVLDTDKIILINHTTTAYSSFKTIRDILKKQGITKFKLVSQ